MFKVDKSIIIAKKERYYLSFPDIIQSKENSNRFFVVYREGDGHHPTKSKLFLMKSENKGNTWRTIKSFILTLKNNGMVWNCPRLSYIDHSLVIICDAKSSTKETMSFFSTFILKSNNEGRTFSVTKTDLPGMVPDKIIKFKNKLFCANHKIKSEKNDLIQLISWSRDNGKTWYDTNILAHNLECQFCEASIVNIDNDYLITYLRDNSGHIRNIYKTTSQDGIFWGEPKKLPIFGQRVTAIKEEDNTIIGTYRNTIDCKLSLFKENLIDEKISIYDIDWEYPTNLYHFGYTGISKIEDNNYLIVYYSKQNEDNPLIKLATISL